MAEYLAPGLFVEEVDSGTKPIEGVGTNTAAFIGFAKSGVFNEPFFVTNWTQFTQEFGQEENALTAALSAEYSLSVSDVRAAKKASRKSWSDFAQDLFKRKNDPLKENQDAKALKDFGAFINKYAVPTNGLPYMEGKYLAHAVRGFYDNGGGRCWIIRIPTQDDISSLKFVPTAALPSVEVGPLLIAAKADAPGTGDVEIDTAVPDTTKPEEFNLTFKRNGVTPDETFGPMTADNVAAQTSASKLATVAVKDKTIPLATAPITLTMPALAVAPTTGGEIATTNGAAPASLDWASLPLANHLNPDSADDFAGDEDARTGMGGILALDDINFIAVPDLMAGVFERQPVPGGDPAKDFGPEVLSAAYNEDMQKNILALQSKLVGYCEIKGDRMAILDPLPGLKPSEMKDTTRNAGYPCQRGQAAIYYPWIKVLDPLHKGQQILVPPSGHMAGIWARVGTQRGIQKAPANESVIGATALEYAITKGEQEILNPYGVNCIRAFPGLGIRCWGARTLATESNPSWKYVNVRRLFNFLESSLEGGLRWVVFEPNTPELWADVRRTITAFLFVQWREGLLFGASPAQAFYVKCDAETNPPETIDLGQLFCEVGVNPVKPAEFVVIRIGQWTASAA